MRDILLLGFIGLCLTAALRYPFAGLLTWAWFTLMTPHQAAYGVFGVPLNVVIAGVAIASYIVSGEIAKFRLDPLTGLIIAFAGWLTLSQVFSLDPDHSLAYYDRLIKTLLFIVLCAQMASDKVRFNALVWTLTLGIGFFAAKGALFTITTFGAFRVQGLPQTVLEDNNHFGIAVATILPLILYLRGEAARAWVRRGLTVLFCLSVVAVIGTHSRGAFLALAAFGGFLWLRSPRKIAVAAGLALILVPTVAFMPGKWTERMLTIGEATQDESFMGRVDAWVINMKLAAENPLTGAGLRNSYQQEIAERVDPARAERAKAAHSIYFEILGGAGYGGLALYLAIFAAAFFAAWGIFLRRKATGPPDWRSNFAYHAQTALAVFAVGGASTSMEMWDGYLIVIALIAALTRIEAAQNAKARPVGHALDAARGNRDGALSHKRERPV